MFINFWRTAHESTTSEIFQAIRPRRLVDHFRYLGFSVIALGIPSVMYYDEIPGRKLILLVELGMMASALPLLYFMKMVHYPALRVLSYQQEIARLRRDLDTRGVAESCMVALSEFLSEMNRLQNQDVRSEHQWLEWQSNYQAIVQSTYILISKGVSNTAALTFVAYPVSEVRYWRGAFSEDHSKMKSILEKYMVKLNAIIQYHYQAMRRDADLQQLSRDEPGLTIAA